MSEWCPDCDGSGDDSMDPSMCCPLCDGDGRVPHEVAETVRREWAAR